MLFSVHWADSILLLKLEDGENPGVYYSNGSLFAGFFENYLFQMAFRMVERTQFLYRIELAASKAKYQEILSEKSAQGFQWTTPMELIVHLLEPYELQKLWFSDEVRFCGVSSVYNVIRHYTRPNGHAFTGIAKQSRYIICVDLQWALNIRVSGDDQDILQRMKKSLMHLFGNLIH